MQAVTLEVILRAVFGVGDPARLERLRGLLGRLLGEIASPALQLRMLVARRFGREDPIDELRRDAATVDEVLYAEIAERRADPGPRRARRHPLDAGRRCGSPTARGWPTTELRDQLITLLLAGHETTATALAWTFDLLLRNPRPLARLRAELDEGGEEYLRAVITRGAAPAPGRAARRAAAGCRAARRRARAARRDRRHPGLLAHAYPPGPLPGAARVPPRALPRPSRRRPTAGFRSAVAFAAASAPPSPSSRCGSCCARCSRGASCAVRDRPRSGSRGATSPSRRDAGHRSILDLAWPGSRAPQLASRRLRTGARLAGPGRLAQLGERRLDKAEVTGSSPVVPIQAGSPDLRRVNVPTAPAQRSLRGVRWKRSPADAG